MLKAVLLMEAKKLAGKPKILECLFLFGVVWASALPYLSKLGFYSDDWTYIATLSACSGEGLTTSAKALLASDSDLRVRPVQVALLLLEFKAFGRSALAYHLLDTLLLALVTMLLYVLLEDLRAGRLLAFVIALIYGLMPHYSTDRFWISSQQSLVCLAFALLGIHAFSRSVQSSERISLGRVALGVLAMILSFLSYEVAVGWIVVSVAMLGRHWYRRSTSHLRRLANVAASFAVAAVLFAVGLIKFHFQSRIALPHHLQNFVGRFGSLSAHAIDQALRFNFWTYGLNLPTVLVSLSRHSAINEPAVAMATLIALSASIFLWRFAELFAIPSRHLSLRLILIGIALFGLGYFLFFTNIQTNFSSAGLNNRTAIASALGASFSLVGSVGLASSLLRSSVARHRAFCIAIGLACGVNCLVVNGIAFFWADASSRQEAILNSVATKVGTLPRGSVLLLDGFCRYSGPGVVFESDWDATGAIQLKFGDYSLTSNVVWPNLKFEESSAEATYGEFRHNYPYASPLFLYNVRDEALIPLLSQKTALSYLQSQRPKWDSGCAGTSEGDGEKVY